MVSQLLVPNKLRIVGRVAEYEWKVTSASHRTLGANATKPKSVIRTVELRNSADFSGLWGNRIIIGQVPKRGNI